MTFDQLLSRAFKEVSESFPECNIYNLSKKDVPKFSIGDFVRVKDSKILGTITSLVWSGSSHLLGYYLNDEYDNSCGFKSSDFRWFSEDELTRV